MTLWAQTPAPHCVLRNAGVPQIAQIVFDFKRLAVNQ
jgi:hypothetical protein